MSKGTAIIRLHSKGVNVAKNLVYLNSSNFEEEVIKSDIPVIVDFWASWCAPCRAIGPLIEELAETSDGKVKIAKLDVEESNDVAARYRVSSIPTIIAFKGGKENERILGANAPAIRQMVKKYSA